MNVGRIDLVVIQYCRVRVGSPDDKAWRIPVSDLNVLLGCKVARNGRVSAQCHRAGGRVSSRGIGAKMRRR